MESRAKLFGHALHPQLIVFPLGLLATAVIFDIIYLITDRRGLAVAAGYMIAAGILGGLVAAFFGLVDYLSIPGGTRAKRIGGVHGAGNALLLALFAISWIIRANATDWRPNGAALVFSFAGVAIAVGTAWLGGELVERLAVGVDEGANLNAPSSMSGQPAQMRRAS